MGRPGALDLGGRRRRLSADHFAVGLAGVAGLVGLTAAGMRAMSWTPRHGGVIQAQRGENAGA